MGLLGGNGGSWSHIPASWSGLVSPLCLCLGKESVKLVCLFCFLLFFLGFFFLFFYFTQLHLSSPWGCLKQEAQLQTPSKFRPILRCGLYLPSSFSFPLKTIQEAALTRTQTSPPHLLLPRGAPRVATVPPRHQQNTIAASLRAAPGPPFP